MTIGETKTPKHDYAALQTALKAAREAAIAAVTADSSDGGSCNFDSCFIFSRRDRKLEAAIGSAGLASSHLNTRMWRGYMLAVPGHGGVGAINTRIAETLERSLKSSGLSVCVYYQLN